MFMFSYVWQWIARIVGILAVRILGLSGSWPVWISAVVLIGVGILGVGILTHTRLFWLFPISHLGTMNIPPVRFPTG